MIHLLAMLILQGATAATIDYDRHWPTQSWKTDNNFIKNHKSEIKDLDNYLFNPSVKTRKTIGAIIIRQGKIVYENYDKGFSKDKPYKTWSISKSVTNALFGIAEREGKLHRTDSICSHGFNKKCDITIENLLHFSSGLDWKEIYEEGESIDKSDVANMLYRKRGQQNMAAYALKKKQKHIPGEYWNYSTGDSSILTAILQKVYKNNYKELPWDQLFNILGMKTAVWEVDRSGNYVGGSYVHASLRDMARFGYLYLNKGVWDGQRLFTRDWFEFTGTPAPAMYNRLDIWSQGIVGGSHWWLNKPLPGTTAPPSPEFPEDAIAALGHWEQYLFVVPSMDLVVVRLGNTREEYDIKGSGQKSFDPRIFLNLVNNLVGDIDEAH